MPLTYLNILTAGYLLLLTALWLFMQAWMKGLSALHNKSGQLNTSPLSVVCLEFHSFDPAHDTKKESHCVCLKRLLVRVRRSYSIRLTGRLLQPSLGALASSSQSWAIRNIRLESGSVSSSATLRLQPHDAKCRGKRQLGRRWEGTGVFRGLRDSGLGF
jgi:hypothetical protein